MFGKNYNFGDISKGLYNKATNVVSNVVTSTVPSQSSTNTETESTDSKQITGYQFGDFSKSVYQTASDAYSNYKFGNLTKSAFYALTSQYEPFKVTPSKIVTEGFLYKKNDKLLSYRAFWCVLDADHQCLFLCDGAQKSDYDRCVQIMELKAFQKVQSVTHFAGYHHQFDVISAYNQRVRFSAPSKMDRSVWIKGLIQCFKAQQLSDLKEEMVSNNNGHGLDLQHIAFYIIDLEFYRSETGEAQQMLKTQNFLIACIIRSYMHKETTQDKQLRESLQEQTWLHPVAATGVIEAESVATGVVTSAGTAVAAAAVGGMFGGLMAAIIADQRINRSNNPHVKKLRPLTPLVEIAGAIAGAIVGIGYGAVAGYQQGYAKVKQKHGMPAPKPFV